MKNNFFTILKYTIINNFNLNKKLKKNKTPILMFASMILISMGFTFMYTLSYYEMMKENNMQCILPTAAMLLGTLGILSTITSKSESILFKPKDFEMLVSMPVKSSTILWTKFAYLLFTSIYLTVIITVPSLIILAARGDISILQAILGGIMSFTIPSIPVAIGFLLSMLISYLSTRFKYTKIVTSILLMLVLLVFAFLPSLISYNITKTNQVITVEKIELMMQKYYYPAYMYNQGIKGDIVFVLGFTIMNLGIISIIILLLSKNYIKIIQKLQETYKINKYVEKKFVKKSQIHSMYIKEIKKLFGTSIYLMNTTFGLLIMLFASIGIMFVDDVSIKEVIGINMIPTILLSISIISMSMSNTASCSISLEGNNIWIYKSSPIKPIKIFISKILVNMTMQLVPYFISLMLLIIRFKLDIQSILLLLVIPVLVSIAVAMFGIIVNLKFPLLKYKSELHVVKQSLASTCAIFGGLLWGILNTSFIIGLPFGKIIFIGELAILVIVEYMILNKWGIKKFNQL